MTNQEGVTRLVACVESKLGPSDSWHEPDAYPESMAMCVIDSIFSINLNYDNNVLKSVCRYVDVLSGIHEGRKVQPAEPPSTVEERRVKAGACQANISDLLKVYSIYNDEELAEAVGRYRTSTTNGDLKTTVVKEAAKLLSERGIETAGDFNAYLENQENDLKEAWTKLKGQGSGVSWSYVQMLAGRPGVKPDRMIQRFVQRCLGPDKESYCDGASDLIHQAADVLGVDPTRLDHAIWSWERAQHEDPDTDV